MIRNQAILINEGNLSSGILEKEREVLENGAIWHKIFVRNAVQYDRDVVLRVFMESVHPHDFIPVKYTIEGENVAFLIKNCSKAIQELCKLNLTITNPYSLSYPFKVAILLRFGTNVQVDVQSSLSKVLLKRYNGFTKVLNLTAFHKDPELIEFCPLSQPKLLYFVLHLSKGYEYRSIKLCNNDIENLKPFEALSSMRSLACVDLRKNNIKEFSELQVLHHWFITEVILEDNPLCLDCSEPNYINQIRRFCPKLQRLDGVTIPHQSRFSCTFRRNFLCDNNGFDLVEQFVEHYFSIYDSSARGTLESMYTKTSCFTVTATYLQGCPSFSHAKLGPYINVSHNINKCADMSKSVNSVHVGSKAIATILNHLPNTEHDPHTFTVDLLHYSDKSAIICVTGVFREPADSLLEVDRVIGFSRTFVLMSVGNNAGFTDEFVIVNETFSVSNATASQEARAFKSGPCEIFKDSRFLHQQHVEVAPARTQNDETQFIDALMKIAGLNSKWANKCLEETNFDLHKALNLFVELYKVDKIPDAAFLSQDEIIKLTMAPPTKVAPVSSLSPKEPLIPVWSQPHLFAPAFVVDERANPYSNDPFDTSRPYQGIERRNRWSTIDTDRNLERDQERELERERERFRERERNREREKEMERERELLRDKRIKSTPPHQHGNSSGQRLISPIVPGTKSIDGGSNQFGKILPRSRSRSNDQLQIVETIDLDAQEEQLNENTTQQKQNPNTPMPVPAPVSATSSAVQNPTPQSNQSSVELLNAEISMSELTEYENKLSNVKGHPNQQQKEVQAIMDSLFAQYPRDVKVWLLSIGTHYKRQIPQKAREMKNRAIKLFSSTPQIGFQIKLAAAQMEMEYVTGPKFSAADKKVGEQNFCQILQQTPNNINITKMYVSCLLKRYADDELTAWNLFKAVAKKASLRVPGGAQDLFDNCKASMQDGVLYDLNEKSANKSHNLLPKMVHTDVGVIKVVPSKPRSNQKAIAKNVHLTKVGDANLRICK